MEKNPPPSLFSTLTRHARVLGWALVYAMIAYSCVRLLAALMRATGLLTPA